jgi:hypothetical protein
MLNLSYISAFKLYFYECVTKKHGGRYETYNRYECITNIGYMQFIARLQTLSYRYRRVHGLKISYCLFGCLFVYITTPFKLHRIFGAK